MGWRFRKSKKILPGVRLNFGKKGVGVTLGTKHAHYTIGADGRRTVSTSIPGTGLSYSEQVKAPSATPRKKGKELSEVPALPYFLLTLFLGPIGAHRFYRGQTGLGILYLLTAGIFAIGWIIDLVYATSNLIRNMKTQ